MLLNSAASQTAVCANVVVAVVLHEKPLRVFRTENRTIDEIDDCIASFFLIVRTNRGVCIAIGFGTRDGAPDVFAPETRDFFSRARRGTIRYEPSLRRNANNRENPLYSYSVYETGVVSGVWPDREDYGRRELARVNVPRKRLRTRHGRLTQWPLVGDETTGPRRTVERSRRKITWQLITVLGPR